MPTKEGARGIGLDAGRVGALTPKRRKVYMMANQGDAPVAIARKLKITRSAVYSHMRHLKRAGLLPETKATSHRRAASNGSVTVTELDEVRNMVTKIRSGISERLTATANRASELERELEHLQAERSELTARDARYAQAEKALAA